MIEFLEPVLYSIVQSYFVKKLVVDVLKALAKQTNNKLDDAAVQAVEDALLKGKN